MEQDPQGVYDTDNTQPTIETTLPDGGGRSGSDAGGNKRDPLASGSGVGATIAGRFINTSVTSDHTNAGTSEAKHAGVVPKHRTGGPDSGPLGETGTEGTEPGSGGYIAAADADQTRDPEDI